MKAPDRTRRWIRAVTTALVTLMVCAGSASAADGISSFFLNMNMLISSAWPQYNDCATAVHGLPVFSS